MKDEKIFIISTFILTDFICRYSSMNSYRQQKRKRGEIIRNQDECMAVNVKKPANGTGQEPQSTLG